MPGAPQEVIQEVLRRSERLVEEGIVANVPDLRATAVYVAANQMVEETELEKVIAFLRAGLGGTVPSQREPLIRKLATFLLIDLANSRNGHHSD